MSLLAAATTTTSQCIGPNAREIVLCTAPGSIHESVNYLSILPVLILGGGALLLLLVSSVLPKRVRPGLYPALTFAVGAAGALSTIAQWIDINHHGARATIGGQVFYDHFSVLFLLLISIATMLGAIFTDSYLRRESLVGVEAYVLMLMAGAGGMLMAVSGGLIMVFLGLEIMSIAMYVMAAYHRRREQSGEAGLKYFILGSFSSAIFLYGVALTYGATGSTQFSDIATFLARNSLNNDGVLLGGMGLLLVGLGFKVAAVPFHLWTPDVYQGAPTPFTGYMAAVAKAAGFAGLLRILDQALISQQINWRPALWLLAVVTLLVGSVLAIVQRDLKRMMAYSSISQAGYVLIGVQAASARGASAALFYVFTYTFIIAGTFAVLSLIQGEGEARNDLGAIRGLGRRKPALAVVMLIFLLAQAGVPFTSGFLAKFYVIEAAVDHGAYALAIIGMLAAAIAAFFYLRVALLMYGTPTGQDEPGLETDAGIQRVGDGAELAGLQPVPSLDGPQAVTTLEAPPETEIRIPVADGIALAVCVAFTIFAGVSSPVIDLARHATTLF
ncbi:MAG TPA: NADH-quinone oxidoreductase subunit N [Acidimicrobiales bacterium]|nr:NADH-quinone oxidoreductase subunit N [Acidimicrobiales bacterium]